MKIEPYSHNVGTCYRCHNDVEPLISAQWFVKMEPLAKEAIRVVEEGETKFVPDRFSKTYLNWMENVHDWCISRQLWWGHQIPAWYDDKGNVYVAHTEEEAQQKFGFLLDAFKYGAPPHAGIALGLDRLVMLMLHLESIRDVIAFPKVKDASCLMTQSPSQVSEAQLHELGLDLEPEKEEEE